MQDYTPNFLRNKEDRKDNQSRITNPAYVSQEGRAQTEMITRGEKGRAIMNPLSCEVWPRPNP